MTRTGSEEYRSRGIYEDRMTGDEEETHKKERSRVDEEERRRGGEGGRG